MHTNEPIIMSSAPTSCSRRCLNLLEKCKNMKHLKQAHAQAFTCSLTNNSYTLSRILAFCSHPTHGNLHHARKLFQHIQNPTICIYNTMIKAFLLRDQIFEVFNLYVTMLQNGMYPDNYTLPYVLKACAKFESRFLGELVHGYCLKLGFGDIIVANSLILMYSSGVFSDMRAARYVFDEMPSPCVVSWTLMISGFAKVGDVESARLFFDRALRKDRGVWGAMISGYLHNNCFKECLYMFNVMQLDSIVPDEGILLSIICACAQLGALDSGIWVHRFTERLGLHRSIRLITGLIDMYAKCGNVDLAKKLFDEMPQRDVVCWNVMISGLAMHGDAEGALKLFTEMEEAGFKPDDVTFIAIFSACSYSGMAYEGLRVLAKMCNVYGIEPKSEHYGCMVDLLSRAGLLEEAKEIIERMPVGSSSSEEAVAWRALLSGCCNQGQAQLAEVAAEKLLQLEVHSGVYALLSNLYATTGRYDEAKRIKKMMRNRGIYKLPGCSSIKINGIIHEFVAGEKTHKQLQDIEFILQKINKELRFLECYSNPVLVDHT
ncbi:pentatricopeptide repeat-containing protein At2g20540-like [Mercurialis annua]|uniref:pentatricopeptide repeat-containing protein At2g20540-like n=1 Tax=Mercurialis annua TaxID=3986 RepID=UPI00215F2E06|nr:pentatricopeptide repeat-containing protein At2g20540-like [Mercurialis annua]